jgi:hypothetical protein
MNETKDFNIHWSDDAMFSAIFTNRYLENICSMSQLEWKLQCFPRIHRAHHNNKVQVH